MTLSIDDLLRGVSLRELARTLRITSRANGFASAAQIARASEVPADLAILAAGAPPAQSARPAAILMTGATGFLGSRLLHLLATTRSVEVTCLVRAENEAAARTRIASALARHGLPVATAEIPRIVLGDLDRDHLGLDQARWDDLAASIDTILHCAGELNMVAAFETLRSANLERSQGSPDLH